MAVLSHVLPPSPSGQSRVLGLLLEGPRSHEALYLTDDPACLAQAESPERRALPQENHFLLPLPAWPGLRQANKTAGMVPAVHRRANQIHRALASRRPRALVAATGSILNLPAARLAADRLGVPLVAYIFDDFRHQWPPGIYRQFARMWESAVMRSAAALIAPNEFLASEYAERYGKQPAIVRNPAAPWEPAPPSSPRPPGGKICIVYTGAVYDAHFDAFVNLMAALAGSDVPAGLEVFSDQPAAWLAEHGISGPVRHHGHVPPADARQVQTEADILFLPLGFNTPKDRAVKSSAPGKLGEYLASGRPILVHAPRDSFIAQFFRERGCGLVVDRPDPALLRAALERLATDQSLVKELTARASEAAQEFSLDAARAAFWGLMDQVTKGGE